MDVTGLAARLLEPIAANRSFGIRVQHAVDGAAAVELEVRPEFGNVIQSLHSSGLIALVDATGLAAVIAAVSDEPEFDGIVPLGAGAQLSFLAPARGRLRGTCRLADADRTILRSLFGGQTDRARLDTEVEVTDERDDVVCRGAFTWDLRRIAGARG